jgi:fructosamine-3-kinase
MMNIQKIIIELINKKTIPANTYEYEPLKGGTVSQLYLLSNSDGNRYVVKSNESQILQAEAFFLDFYQDSKLLPKLLYVDESNSYIVYSFLSGTTNYNSCNKRFLLRRLVTDMLNHYKLVPNPNGWGWMDEPTDSWQDFLLQRVLEATRLLDSYLEPADTDLVVNLVKSSDRMIGLSGPYLLHGDFGIHNFIWKEGQLAGVIDPAPVYGEPLYDLIYAFCSSAEDLTVETFDFAVSHLSNKGGKEGRILYEEVLIGLYLRIASCVKHHPQDLKDYLEAWDYWKKTCIE